MVTWVGLQYVIVVFPDHTLLLFDTTFKFHGRKFHHAAWA